MHVQEDWHNQWHRPHVVNSEYVPDMLTMRGSCVNFVNTRRFGPGAVVVYQLTL